MHFWEIIWLVKIFYDNLMYASLWRNAARGFYGFLICTNLLIFMKVSTEFVTNNRRYDDDDWDKFFSEVFFETIALLFQQALDEKCGIIGVK